MEDNTGADTSNNKIDNGNVLGIWEFNWCRMRNIPKKKNITISFIAQK